MPEVIQILGHFRYALLVLKDRYPEVSQNLRDLFTLLLVWKSNASEEHEKGSGPKSGPLQNIQIHG